MKPRLLICSIFLFFCIIPFSRTADPAPVQQPTPPTPVQQPQTPNTTPTQSQPAPQNPTPITDESADDTSPTSTSTGTDPYGGLLLPQVRNGTDFSSQSHKICGGTKREKPRYITTQNVSNEFKWLIETPFADGKCSFRISPGVEQSNETAYIQLIPDEQQNITTENGWFSCGQTKGVGKAYIQFPEDIDCDSCILEWIWKTSDFEIRQCADISVLSEQSEQCRGICENGGVCHKGKCRCKAGYTGDYCETRTDTTVKRVLSNLPHIAFYVILAIIFILGVVVLILWFVKTKKPDESAQQAGARSGQGKYQEFENEVQARPKPAIQLAVKV